MQPISFLVVDDDDGDRRLIVRTLKQAGVHADCTQAASIHDALAACEQQSFDCAIVDYMLPGQDGLTVITELRQKCPHMAIVMVTGQGDEFIASEAIKRGASDYIPKASITAEAMERSVRNALDKAHLLRRVAEQGAELARLQTEEHARQIQLRDYFLSHVSHELRSPLTSICSFSSLMAEGLAGPTTEQQSEFLDIIQKNVTQLEAMIEDLLTVTSSKTGKLTVQPQAIVVKDAILEAVQTCGAAARAKGVDLSFAPSTSDALAYADPVRLRQVIIILCDNAVKFTPSGGAVNVRVALWDKTAGFFVVEVADTGRGIPQEKTGRIFEHLYQVTEDGEAGRKGLGLGLHIAQELVVRQGGDIWVTSNHGMGSRFSFTVPIFAGQDVVAPSLADA